MQMNVISRRGVLKSGMAMAGALAMPAIVSNRVLAQSGTRDLNMQLGWLPGGDQLGEITAKHLGYFEEEGLNFAIQAGGPNIDGVAIVASGRFELGQVSSSPSLMLAASQGIPVKCFAIGKQEHPYAFFSLPANPIRSTKDMAGKKIGVQATAQVLLNALLVKHGMSEGEVEPVIIGSDATPILTKQVDAAGGWLTNASWASALGPDIVSLRLWDEGVQLYAHPYYAQSDTIEQDPELLAKFLRAAAKGWAHAKSNPEEAVGYLVKEYPNLKSESELATAKIGFTYSFTETTRQNGWATFDPAVWEAQIRLYDELDQFSAGAPKVEDVITTAILEATAADRPKIG